MTPKAKVTGNLHYQSMSQKYYDIILQLATLVHSQTYASVRRFRWTTSDKNLLQEIQKISLI